MRIQKMNKIPICNIHQRTNERERESDFFFCNSFAFVSELLLSSTSIRTECSWVTVVFITCIDSMRSFHRITESEMVFWVSKFLKYNNSRFYATLFLFFAFCIHTVPFGLVFCCCCFLLNRFCSIFIPNLIKLSQMITIFVI